MDSHDNDPSFKVDPLYRTAKPFFKKTASRKEHKEKHPKRPFKERARDHFKELSEAVEKAHERLVEMNSPYRFCVYEEDGEIFIDLVLLDEQGKIGSIQKKNITDDEFFTWLNTIETGEGLLVDEDG